MGAFDEMENEEAAEPMLTPAPALKGDRTAAQLRSAELRHVPGRTLAMPRFANLLHLYRASETVADMVGK